MVISTGEMLLRLGASVAAGAIIGYEREKAGRPAGLRTQLLVSLASATFMIVSTQFVFFQPYSKDDLVTVDSSRIAASVVAGVGFLGAGAILRTGIGIQGLTTAASLWMMASIGLAAGGGMYLLTGVSTVVSFVCLSFLRRLEGKQWRLMLRRVVVVLDDVPGHSDRAIELLGLAGASVSDVELDRNFETRKTRLSVEVRFANREALDRLLVELTQAVGVRRVKVQRPG